MINYFFIILTFTAIVVALFLIGLGVKMLVKKNGEFKKQCSVVDPLTGERVGCTCGKKATDVCKNEPKHYPLEINKEVLEEL